MKMPKSKLDEMQEQKLLKIESVGFWIAYLGLFAISAVQIMMGMDPIHAMDNMILGIILSVYMWVRCYKYGIWDRFFAPSVKFNVIISFVVSVIIGFVNYGTFTFFEWPEKAALKAAVISAAGYFALCLVMQTISLKLYKKRRNKLDGE